MTGQGLDVTGRFSNMNEPVSAVAMETSSAREVVDSMGVSRRVLNFKACLNGRSVQSSLADTYTVRELVEIDYYCCYCVVIFR